jgi:hypothetical protein
MLTNRAKMMEAIFLSVVLCIFACIGIGMLLTKLGEGSGRAPVQGLRVTINKSQREELFDQLQKFADKHAFEFLLRKAGPNGEGYFIEMLRDDIYINASITRVDPKIVSIRFYNNDTTYPASREIVDGLLNDLKSFLSEITDIRITEEK